MWIFRAEEIKIYKALAEVSKLAFSLQNKNNTQEITR